MHKSVLLNECLENLKIKDDLIYVDATLGYAGHSREILKRIKKGFLFAFDQDIKAVTYSQKELSKISSKYEIIKSNFKNMKKELEKRKVFKVDGILFDLGVSSPQLDEFKRGFSYHQDALLDMRMDLEQSLTAYYIVNNYSYEELVNILKRYGEERYSKAIASKIIHERNKKEIRTTLELVELIKSVVPEKYKRTTHPARRSFQALRIEVNDELNILEKTLEESIFLLNKGGRLCIITFHSLEERICTKIFKKYSQVPKELSKLPNVPKEYQPIIKIIGKYYPTKEEINFNHRARSAKLRVIEKL